MDYYVVDAFTDKVFSGNPAGICVMDKPLEDATMQLIAKENNLPETAFLLIDNGVYNLRWFTREFEIDLCGHGTLATAYVVFNYIEPNAVKVSFNTLSGPLTVSRFGDSYELDFPLRSPSKVDITPSIIETLGFVPSGLYANRDLYVLMDSQDYVSSYCPDYNKLCKLTEYLGVVITAKGNDCDFVSRYFCTELREEDPVTGSAHCVLAPLWKNILDKNSFHARQLSSRGGTLHCIIDGDRVKIRGNAVLFSKGKIIL